MYKLRAAVLIKERGILDWTFYTGRISFKIKITESLALIRSMTHYFTKPATVMC